MTIKKSVRIIARLDVKYPNLIKGVNLEGVRVIGDPAKYARRYYEQGIDELIYMDAVATLYGRNHLLDIVRYTADHVFVPMTVGGGVRTLEDVESLLHAGADKVAVNTAAVHSPDFISDIAKRFGSQCVVLSVEAVNHGEHQWQAYTDCGREKTGRCVLDWVKQAENCGAGEVLLTSVDKEGTCQGFDTELVKSVSDIISVPLIVSGGYGNVHHGNNLLKDTGADAMAIAHMLHYDKMHVDDIKRGLDQEIFQIRIV